MKRLHIIHEQCNRNCMLGLLTSRKRFIEVPVKRSNSGGLCFVFVLLSWLEACTVIALRGVGLVSSSSLVCLFVESKTYFKTAFSTWAWYHLRHLATWSWYHLHWLPDRRYDQNGQWPPNLTAPQPLCFLAALFNLGTCPWISSLSIGSKIECNENYVNLHSKPVCFVIIYMRFLDTL